MEALHEEMPFDLDFHPSTPLVATSLINGELHLLFAVNAHEESCRAVRFVDSGTVILTGSADSSILASDVETGKAIARLEDAHDNAINRLVCLTETTVASGDDEGCIKVKAQSEFSEDELLSLVVMKNGQKVVCGTPSGALLLYSWGHFKDCSDRFLGHSQSVDTLLKLDEETLISGAADGVIRLVSILPNQIKQPLAEHSEYPIEALGFSHDRKYLGSVSHDKILKLWDIEELLAGPQLDNHNDLPEAAAAADHGELPEANVAVDHNEVQTEADSDDAEMDIDMEPSSSNASKSKKKGKGKRLNGFQPDFFADL
ncbi:hypothetical protein ACQ4PT_045081 [Festuca glaucescens]